MFELTIKLTRRCYRAEIFIALVYGIALIVQCTPVFIMEQ
jgi:hypothetical protein